MPSNPNEERQDSQRNRAKIQKEILRIVKRELRRPTVQELVQATGLSDKTVKAHLKRVKLGNGAPNPFQVLTASVIMALHKKAVGYEQDSVKVLTVSDGAGCGSHVEEVDIVEHFGPDVAAAKLWMQLVEGFTEKSETEHTGNVGFSFNYVAPEAPKDGD